jgi:hypothetical protein
LEDLPFVDEGLDAATVAVRVANAGAKGWCTLGIRSSLAILTLLFVPAISGASELKQDTLRAWGEYVQAFTLRVDQHLAPGQPFLWIDEASAQRQRVRQGEVLISPTREGNPHPVPHGLIHDWIGAVFIPHVTIDDVFAVVHDYDRYDTVYKPGIVEAKLLGRTGEEYRFSLVGLKKVLFWTVVLEGEFESNCSQLGSRRWYCAFASTRIQEIQDYGQADARKLPPDEGHGYTWRFQSVTRFEEADGGVYLEFEMIALSRDVWAARWLSKPVVERVSRDAIFTILQRARDAVQSKIAQQQ